MPSLKMLHAYQLAAKLIEVAQCPGTLEKQDVIQVFKKVTKALEDDVNA